MNLLDWPALGTILAVIALGANIITLFIVLRQTRLTAQAVRAAEESTADTRKRMFLDLLPKFGAVIDVQVALQLWEEQLEAFAQAGERVVKDGDLDLLKKMAQTAPQSHQGVLKLRIYRHLPAWLKNLYVSGGQHFYGAVGGLSEFWNFEEERPTWGANIDMGVGQSFARRCRESIAYIQDLRQLLDDTLPEACLEAPASLSELDLLDHRPAETE